VYAVAGQDWPDHPKLVNAQTNDWGDVEEPGLVDEPLADRQGVDG
jgi:hypothetical protein